MSQYCLWLLRWLRVLPAHPFSHHPQTDGQTERVNAILKQYLRCLKALSLCCPWTAESVAVGGWRLHDEQYLAHAPKDVDISESGRVCDAFVQPKQLAGLTVVVDADQDDQEAAQAHCSMWRAFHLSMCAGVQNTQRKYPVQRHVHTQWTVSRRGRGGEEQVTHSALLI